ncbi:hypothetical protein DFP73DRAFT_9517 [Morchella snyderi]|nr:hypothetical protein DFP73DRAFT_9517 [Morchella snyderi]
MYTSFFASFAWAGLHFFFTFNSPSFWVAFFWSGVVLFFFFTGFIYFPGQIFSFVFSFFFFEDFSQWDFYIGVGGRCTKCKVLQFLRVG